MNLRSSNTCEHHKNCEYSRVFVLRFVFAVAKIFDLCTTHNSHASNGAVLPRPGFRNFVTLMCSTNTAKYRLYRSTLEFWLSAKPVDHKSLREEKITAVASRTRSSRYYRLQSLRVFTTRCDSCFPTTGRHHWTTPSASIAKIEDISSYLKTATFSMKEGVWSLGSSYRVILRTKYGGLWLSQ